MQVLKFHCPHCSADLKIRAAEIGDRPLDCPDCRKPMIVRSDASGQVTATRPNEPVPRKPAAPKTSAKLSPANEGPPGQTVAARGQAAQPADRSQPVPTALRAQSKPAPARSQSPQQSAETARGAAPGTRRWLAFTAIPATAWIGIGSATVAIVLAGLGWVYWPRSAGSDAPPAQQVGTQKNHVAETGSPTPQPGASGKAILPAKSLATSTAGRMAGLGELIAAYRSRRGQFPVGTVHQGTVAPKDRLSWLAELTATIIQPDAAPPLWNEPWSSPRNERFVRQSIPEFLNPNIKKLVGPQNFPATHFVGVAGVGEDAPNLAVDHPRAGIFGNDRVTRMEDIRDGATNTLMVMGVSEELGSWAAAGPATVRPLTREPYVNGPDGFGTGSPDRMTVLMADGSVRELSSKTDPRLIRRMAAMSDGLPLDLRVPGEPGDGSHHAWPKPPEVVKSTPIKMVARSPVVATKPAASPAAAPATAPMVNAPPAKRTVDIAGNLRQPIVRFQQSRPARLRDVLTVLEEMVSAPVKGDQREITDLDDLMETPVEFDLQNTTVGDVLTAVLSKAKLAYEVEPDCIRLRKFATAPVGGSVP